MAKALLFARGVFGQQNNSMFTTVSPSTQGGAQTTEAAVTSRSPAGTYADLSVHVLTYFGPSNTLTVSLRVNGADSALVVACPAGTTGRFENLSDTVVVSDGDLVALRFRGNGAPYSNTTANAASLTFEATAPGVEVTQACRLAVATSATSRVYFAWAGSFQAFQLAADAQVQQVIRAPGTVDRGRVSVTANTRTLGSTLTLHKNGVDTSVSMAIPAGTTGQFEDLVNSTTVADGDTLCWALDPGGTGSLTMFAVQTRFQGAGNAFDTFASRATGGSNIDDGYAAPFGVFQTGATEVANTTRLNAQATLSNLRAQAGNGVTPCTTTVWINGAPANLTVTWPSGAAGYYEDSTHTDAVDPGDDFTLRCETADLAQAAWVGLTWTVGVPGVEVFPTAGQVEVQGEAPDVVVDEVVSPTAGQVDVVGLAPDVRINFDANPSPGVVEVHGAEPQVFVGINLTPEPGAVEVRGAVPLVVTDAFTAVSQAPQLVLGEGDAAARASQAAQLVMGAVVPDVRATQAVQLALATAVPCITHWCQVWIIRRLDGEVLAFTSLDRSIQFHGLTARSCASLMASATEGAANIGAVANMELAGIIDSDAITEADLWAGAYDGARVEVWLVPWAGTETPRRLAAGWAGKVSQGERGFTMEVLGPGARLEQQAITEPFTPGCRWVFGDGRCPVDVDALKVAGVITTPVNRRRFTAAALAGPPANPFTQGRVEFLTGANAGFRSETKDFDPDTGTFTLWLPTPQPMAPGDTFEAFPGCDKTKPTCQDYGAFDSFGGFPDIPGADSLTETPDAKY